MRNNLLLPNKFKKIGLVLFIAAVLCGLASWIFKWDINMKVFALADEFIDGWEFCKVVETGIMDEILMAVSLVALCFMALSKEKDEDEMTGIIRMRCFVWTFWVTAAILLFGTLFLYELASLYFSYCALLLVFLLFILKFNITMYKVRRESR